jgi:hypothetical protein
MDNCAEPGSCNVVHLDASASLCIVVAHHKATRGDPFRAQTITDYIMME